MKVLNILIIAILALLGFAAGIAKLMLAPHEVAFFAKFGLSELVVIIAGGLQVLGAVGLAITKLRLFAAALTAVCFGTSSILIFANGQTLFGAVSLLPVLLSLYVAWRTKEPSSL